MIYAPADDGTQFPGWPSGQPVTVPPRQIGPLRWGKGLRQRVESDQPDLVHTHGLWGQSSLVAGRMGSTGLGKVISPHGMLDPWALGNGRFRKEVAMKLFERRNLASADCLHALCRSEAESIRALGFENPIAIIPNGVDLPEIEEGNMRTSEREVLLFLGRLHPKKGLPNALRAFARFRAGDRVGEEGRPWQFVIAGWGQGGHDEELHELCRELKLTHSSLPAEEWVDSVDAGKVSADSQVVFVGPVFGKTKERILQHSSAFILPSFSEGLPVAVLEAWAYGLPVVMTEHCNLPEGFEAQAAIKIGTDVEGISKGLSQLFDSGATRNRQTGENGRRLVESRFTWPQVAEQMDHLYRWILKRGERPGSVEVV